MAFENLCRSAAALTNERARTGELSVYPLFLPPRVASPLGERPLAIVPRLQLISDVGFRFTGRLVSPELFTATILPSHGDEPRAIRVLPGTRHRWLWRDVSLG